MSAHIVRGFDLDTEEGRLAYFANWGPEEWGRLAAAVIEFRATGELPS